MNGLVKLVKPKLPVYWEYKISTKFVSDNIFKWKNLTEDVAKELWIAREMLSKQGARTDLTSEQKFRGWAGYCEEIGSSKQVVNRWLKQWFETVHVSHNSGENEWYTPKYIIDAAKETMGSIDLDPATSELANETVKAEEIFTKENDGFDKEWTGNVWLNPPYAQPLINEFSDKLISELDNIEQACVLVNNATETNWFQNMLEVCDAVCFLKSRVKFIDMNGKASGAPLQGQAVLYFGNRVKIFSIKYNNYGICMTRIEV